MHLKSDFLHCYFELQQFKPDYCTMVVNFSTFSRQLQRNELVSADSNDASNLRHMLWKIKELNETQEMKLPSPKFTYVLFVNYDNG